MNSFMSEVARCSGNKDHCKQNPTDRNQVSHFEQLLLVMLISPIARASKRLLSQEKIGRDKFTWLNLEMD